MRAPGLDSFVPEPGSDHGRSEREVAEGVRAYVHELRDHLIRLHRSGASGQQVNEAHSDHMDRMVRRLFECAEERSFAGGEEAGTDFCVLAVGGYARREMSIHSDLDILFVYRDALTPHVASVAERLQYWLWDAKLTVGGATRTIRESVALAREDPTVRTSLLAPRFLVGSGVLFHEFCDSVRRKALPPPRRFVEEQIASLRQRHEQYGDTLYLLQPNVKESAGGLRDYHAAFWTMVASLPAARGRADFLHLGLLTEEELEKYDAALDFLWRARNELHSETGRKTDQLSFELQEHMAEFLGHAAGPSELPVERFMREYYRHALAIRNASSLVMEQCHARVRRPERRRVQELAGGFRIANGQLEIPHARQLREQPTRLLEAFAVAQEQDVPLTRKALRLVRENLFLVDEGFQRSRAARDLFLRILEARKRVTSSLIAMNEVGLLARYLPEWEHIVCRWQHVIYHTYTVDVHSIFLVEELRRLLLGEHEKELPELSELMRSVEDRPVLFLGCLLHDIGKGFGGDHSRKGAERSRSCLERIGLEPERIERVVFLVDLHLLMSQIAQSRDLSDPKIIREFAQRVGDRTNLHYLYLLTFADVRASSPGGWTEWRGQLLRELFERSSEMLETGSKDEEQAVERIERRVEKRREAAASELRSLGLPDTKIRAYFDMMPRRYFVSHTPPQIARHAAVVFHFGDEERLLATAWRRMRAGFSEFIVCTRDVHGLYADVAGTLTAHGINILGANVYTARSGIALEIYRVTTPSERVEEEALTWADVEASLVKVLRRELDTEELLRRRGRRLGEVSVKSQLPSQVEISNSVSDFYTVVDVVTDDRLGLLYSLTRVIADQGYEIYISKAGRVLDQVSDTFYLKDPERKKIQDPEALERLREALLATVERRGAAGGD